MIDRNTQLELQAYADGELSGEAVAAVEALLARDTEARSLVQTMRISRQVLREYEAGIRLPESREFFWSKIQREIETPQHKWEPTPASWLAWLRQALVPASAIAVVTIAGLFAASQSGMIGSSRVTRLDAALASSGTFTYRDFSTGTTLVWLSYPAEKSVAE